METKFKISQKINKFLFDPKTENLLSLEEYKQLSPYAQGYVSYMQASWEESELADENPFKEGTKEFAEFNRGSHHAMIITQDMSG
jgi:hypothetical protein